MIRYLEWLGLVTVTIICLLFLAMAIYSAYQVFTAKEKDDGKAGVQLKKVE